MDKEIWKNRVFEELESLLGDAYHVQKLEKPQEEEEPVLALGITKAGEVSGITVEMDDAEKACKEQEIKPVAEYLAEMYYQKRSCLQGSGLENNSLSVWKDRIIFKLDKRPDSSERLSTIPHKEFLDMEIIFELVEKTENPCFSRRIINEDVKEWGKSLSDIWKLARKNTPKLFSPVIYWYEEDGNEPYTMCESNLQAFLNNEQGEKQPFYILTNSNYVNGAACILYENVLKNLADKWQEDIVLLPISIHEIGLIPFSNLTMTLDEWQVNVKEINQNEGCKGEVLSDSVYLYDWKAGEIKLVSSGANQAKYYTS